MTDDIIRRTSRLAFISIFAVIVGTGIIRAVLPAGALFSYTPIEQPEIGPENRVIATTLAGESVTKITDDNVYFTVDTPIRFSKAEVTVVFENPDDQEVVLGFKDRQTWHYETKLIQSPMLDKLSWSRTGTDPVLFQKTSKYSSVAEFFSQYSQANKTGGYYYSQPLIDQLEGYIPKTSLSTISNPRLRGDQTMYVYLNKEPFYIKFSVKDLNETKGNDSITLRVYKDDEEVLTEEYADDGITDASLYKQPIQDITIQNPGDEYPEPGTYKVEFKASSDILIQEIRTNLHKITFEGPLVLSGSNVDTDLTTNASSISALIDKNDISSQQPLASGSGVHTIRVPSNSINISGNGYFSYSKDHFFEPTPIYLVPIRKFADLKTVSYLLTSEYEPPKVEGNWKSRKISFNLENAYVQNGKLNWIIQAPGLKKFKRSLFIKDIQIHLIKE